MDKEALVKEIRVTLSEFMQKVCKINVAMLIKDINSETYTFVLSSYLLNILTPYDGTKLVAEYFYNNLSREAFSIISRINIVNTADPSILSIYKAIKISGGTATIKNCTFFNVFIEDAIILESNRD